MEKTDQQRRGTQTQRQQEAMTYRSERAVRPRGDTCSGSSVLDYAAGEPRKSAKRSGTPKSLMLKCLSVGVRALRIRRCAQESRTCAR